ncbi:O-antigen ligase family protein [Arthrobacter sp. Br18]|uniref:O-antigen ligase family protein n=1 Tax=Arthrobacter sp. Br18 TaxID=1312954 RepID=UPI001C1E3053|nr:O-antigen ligase family protein [Arthrobacter sp. Br18]
MSAAARERAACLVWLLSILSVVAWRKGVFFDGGIDPVVVAKALLQGSALGGALLIRAHSPSRFPVAGAPLLILGLVVSISVIGAYAAGNVVASAVLAVRIMLVASTVSVLVSSFPRTVVLKHLAVALGILGAFVALTGLGGLAAGERLEGTVLPLSPNALALLCGFPALALLHAGLNGRGRGGAALLGVLFLGACIATQSRTALFALAAAAVVLMLHVRRMEPKVAMGLLAAIPLSAVLLMYTPILRTVVARGDAASILTLNSRTIAWEAVLDTPSLSWERWLGAGLSVKTIAVKGQYWQEQVLDSSWVSALAQTGVLGTVVIAAWVLTVLWRSMKDHELRSFSTAILVFILLRSFLENGLIEASTTFLVFMTVALLVQGKGAVAEPPSRVVPRVSVDHLASASNYRRNTNGLLVSD